MGSIFSPKTPSPPPVPPAPTTDSVAGDPAIREDRLRRQRAAGRQSNITSDLRNQVEDVNFQSRVSKLLG